MDVGSGQKSVVADVRNHYSVVISDSKLSGTFIVERISDQISSQRRIMAPNKRLFKRI
jgi:hypothetical protein